MWLFMIILLIMSPDYLNSKEKPDSVYSWEVSRAEHHRKKSRGQHSNREEYSEVHPLRHEAADEHENGVGHEVGSVQQTK